MPTQILNLPIRIPRNPASLLALAATILAAAGCGGSKSSSGTTGPTGPTGPTTGSLTVTIAAPVGVTANVTVTGPSSYTKALAVTTTLTGLKPGSYTIAAPSVVTAGAIVAGMASATITGSPATVTTSTTAATASATYAARPGSGSLWIVNFGGTETAVQFTAAQLASTTSAAATSIISIPMSNELGAAVDLSGNVWVSRFGGTSIQEYSTEQLLVSGTPTPAVILSTNGSNSIDNPAGMAFDASGNLWVANVASNTIVEFSASELTSTGAPTPAVTVSATAGSVNSPWGIAFDTAGNLWVANLFGETLVKFTPAQLAASGSPIPAVTISDTASSIVGPLFIAFDSTGNLWVANGNFSQNTVVAFSPSQLAATGKPVPVITLSANAGSINHPEGLAFDDSGNLWVSSLGSNTVVEFAASLIATTGNPLPTTTISGSSLINPAGLAFNPHSSSLPLK